MELTLFVLSYLASVLSSSLPMIAFEFCTDWEKVMDCFSPSSLFLGLVSAHLRLFFFLFAIGKNTLEGVFDSVTTIYIEILLTCAAIFLYHTVKKHRNENDDPDETRVHYMAFVMLAASLAVLTAFGALSYRKWTMSEWGMDILYAAIVITLALETAWPVMFRYMEDEFEDDSALIFTIKMLATAMCLFTSVVDAVNFQKEDFEKEHFTVKKWAVVSVPIMTAAVSGIQMVIRIVGPRKAKELTSFVCTKIRDGFGACIGPQDGDEEVPIP